MPIAKRILAPAILLIFAAALAAVDPPTAIEQYPAIKAELRKSRADQDWRSSLASAKQLGNFLHGSPGSLLEVARANVHVGDLDAAFRILDEFVRMGQAVDLLKTSPEFAPIRTRPEYGRIQNGMKENGRPISLASTAFALADPDLLAEDVSYDGNSKRFFVTSVREKKIISSDANGNSTQFAAAPDKWPMLAIKVDSSRGVLWATEVALKGYLFAPDSEWGRSAVLCYDLGSGKLLRRVEGPQGSALGDLALAANGDVIVSDGQSGGVYRLAADGSTLQRVDSGDFISPQTPAMHPDGTHIFVPDYLRGIGLLDLQTRAVQWLSTEGKFALSGVDGLYFDHGSLIAVQNGTSPERVIAFTLDASLSKIKSETIIERSTETLGDPTHGVVLADDFFYIANSGWDVIDDHGNMQPGAKKSAPRMMRVKIQHG